MALPGPFEILILAAVAIVPLALLVGIVVLLCNEKTRIAGIVLAVFLVLGGFGVLGLGAVMWFTVGQEAADPYSNTVEIEFPEDVAQSAESRTVPQLSGEEEPRVEEEPLAEDTSEQTLPEDAGSD